MAGISDIFVLGDVILVVSAFAGFAGGELGGGFGETCASLLLSVLTTDGGGGTLAEAGLNAGFVGSGDVMGRPAGGAPEVGAAVAPDRMGAVFAERARVNGERGALLTSRCAGAGGEASLGVAEAAGESRPDGGMLPRLARGAVLWASAFARDSPDTFF